MQGIAVDLHGLALGASIGFALEVSRLVSRANLEQNCKAKGPREDLFANAVHLHYAHLQAATKA